MGVLTLASHAIHGGDEFALVGVLIAAIIAAIVFCICRLFLSQLVSGLIAAAVFLILLF